MKIDLRGKTVLVTGAGSGIGESIARQLALSGACVAIHYFNSEKKALLLAKEIGNNSFAIGADLSCPVATRKLFKQVLARVGKLDILINNAAMAISTPIDSESFEDNWEMTLAVNLRAPALLCKAAIKHYRDHGGGRIINIASRAAFKGDAPEYLAYEASKGGLISLSKSIASHFGKEGIMCFVVAPGVVRKDMANSFFDEYGDAEESGDLVLKNINRPEDIASSVVFLASGLADHAAGTNIDINAGSYLH